MIWSSLRILSGRLRPRACWRPKRRRNYFLLVLINRCLFRTLTFVRDFSIFSTDFIGEFLIMLLLFSGFICIIDRVTHLIVEILSSRLNIETFLLTSNGCLLRTIWLRNPKTLMPNFMRDHIRLILEAFIEVFLPPSLKISASNSRQ